MNPVVENGIKRGLKNKVMIILNFVKIINNLKGNMLFLSNAISH